MIIAPPTFPVPRTGQEYLEQLKENLNWFERTLTGLSGTDERLDMLARLQIEQLRVLEAGLNIQLPKPTEPFPGIPHYNVRKLALDTAKTTSDPEEVQLPGDVITFYTDGTLTGIQFALDNPSNDWIPVAEFGNPYRYPAKFKKIYLAWTAQSGKYLRIHVGREAGAEASLQLTTVSRETRSTFTHNQVTVGTSAVQLSSTSFDLWFGLAIKADDNNTSDVYIGGSTVSSTTGYRLIAGQGITIEVDDVTRVYAIAGAAAQEVQYIGV